MLAYSQVQTTKNSSCSLAALKKKEKNKYQRLLSLFHADSTEFNLIQLMQLPAIIDLATKHLRDQDSTRFPCPLSPQCHITTILSVKQEGNGDVSNLDNIHSNILSYASDIANHDYAKLTWLTIIPLVGASSTAVPILMNLSDLKSNIPLYMKVALIGLAVGLGIAIMCAIPMAMRVRHKRNTLKKTIIEKLKNISLLSQKTQQENSTRGSTNSFSSNDSEVEL